MDIPQVIFENPYTTAALVGALIILLAFLRRVGPRRAIAVEQLRGLCFRALNPLARRYGRPLTITKDDSEHIATVQCGLLQLSKLLWAHGYRYNPISTKKARHTDQGKQWSVLTVAYRDDILAPDQHHVYIFRSPGGGYAIYGHAEANVTKPEPHETGDGLIPGDPNDRLTPVLDGLER